MLNGRIATPSSHQLADSSVNAGDLQASLSRLPTGPYDGGSLTFNSIQPSGREDVCKFLVISTECQLTNNIVSV